MRRPDWSTALALLLAGCGYHQGFGTESLGIRSVAIATVENETYRQGLDVLLTRRLGRDLTEFTGLVPGTPEQADAILEVTLKEVSGRSIVEGSGGSIVEGALLLAAEVRLRDRRTGEVIHASKHHDWAEFRAAVGESLISAQTEAVADLSRRILIAIGR